MEALIYRSLLAMRPSGHILNINLVIDDVPVPCYCSGTDLMSINFALT